MSGGGRIEDHWVKDNIFKRMQALTLSDLDIQLEMIKGKEGEQDVSCYSKFMLGIMDELGNSG